MQRAHFIFYVADQDRSSRFYSAVLSLTPQLHVPGMTEFVLPGGSVLGLMPEQGIFKLLAPRLRHPADGAGVARAELYLVVDSPAAFHARALAAGAVELSALQPRNWGHTAAYCADPDGHVLAFASDSQQDEVASAGAVLASKTM